MCKIHNDTRNLVMVIATMQVETQCYCAFAVHVNQHIDDAQGDEATREPNRVPGSMRDLPPTLDALLFRSDIIELAVKTHTQSNRELAAPLLPTYTKSVRNSSQVTESRSPLSLLRCC